MALHQDDLMVVQKHDGAQEIRKATIQQLSDYLQTTDSVVYKGLANFSQAGEEPATRNQGDLYINNGPDDGAWNWAAGNSGGVTVVNTGDRAIWNATDNTWDVIQSSGGGSGTGGVSEVTGSLPIEVENGATSSPNVTVNDATEGSSGVVTLASNQDVIDGASGVVVTADQLKSTNDQIGILVSGNVTTIIPVDPIEVDTDGTNSSSPTSPAISVKESAVGQKGVVEKYDATTDPGDPSSQPTYAQWVATLDATGFVTFKAVAQHFLWADFSGLEDA